MCTESTGINASNKKKKKTARNRGDTREHRGGTEEAQREAQREAQGLKEGRSGAQRGLKEGLKEAQRRQGTR